MRFKIGVLLVLLVVILASCSSVSQVVPSRSVTGGESKADLGEEVTVGEGLEVNLRVDDDFIDIRELEYKLTLENSGRDEVVLNREDVILTTTRRTIDGNIVLTQASLDQFYRLLFDGKDQLRLFHDQKIEIVGILEIDHDFFADLTNEEFTFSLSFAYDYKTEFTNNVELDLQRKEIDVTDRITQAAPIKVTDIDFIPRLSGDFAAVYTVEDRGTALSSGASGIEIIDYSFIFSSDPITGGCTPFVEVEDSKRIIEGSIILTPDQDRILFMCDISTSNFQEFGIETTITSGTLEYRYTITEDENVNLPSTRQDEFFLR